MEDAYWGGDTAASQDAREQFAGFDRKEVSSTYVGRDDRFVVSLVVGYGDGSDTGVTSSLEACHYALELTRDLGSPGTQWYVHDRKTGQTLCLQQQEFDGEGWDNEDEEDET